MRQEVRDWVCFVSWYRVGELLLPSYTTHKPGVGVHLGASGRPRQEDYKAEALLDQLHKELRGRTWAV